MDNLKEQKDSFLKNLLSSLSYWLILIMFIALMYNRKEYNVLNLELQECQTPEIIVAPAVRSFDSSMTAYLGSEDYRLEGD